MRQFIIIFTIVFIIAGAVAYWLGFGRTLTYKKHQLTLRDRTFTVEIADTMATRAQGLSNREALARDQGMLFFFDQPGNYGFWMKDMNFPIDILWFKGERLVGITENVPPPEPGTGILSLRTYNPPEDIDRVLEINAGLSREYGFKAGDEYSLVIE